jgi:acetolactate synthase-1/2/3 large subunit
MFPGLNSLDVTDIDGFDAAMRYSLAGDGPTVVSVECAADEIPPFAPFLGQLRAKEISAHKFSTTKEDHPHVAASA